MVLNTKYAHLAIVRSSAPKLRGQASPEVASPGLASHLTPTSCYHLPED